MEEDIGQHGGNAPALDNACLGVRQSALFHHSGTQPFPNETQNAAIIDPLAQHLAQACSVDAVVGREKPRLPLCFSPQVKPGVRISRTGLPRTHS